MKVKPDMYRRILVATDGSEASYLAAKHAIELAKTLGSKIIALYVVDRSAISSLPSESLKNTIRSLLEEEGRKALEKIERMCVEAGVSAETLMSEGSPAEEIVRISEDREVNLIVLGSSIKRGLDKLLLGSVAEKVARASSIPVLIVKRTSGERNVG